MSLARISSLKTRITNFSTKITERLQSVELPEKYKGTIVEKWAKYWKTVGTDYFDVVQSVRTDVREKPLKAAILASIAFGCYLAGKRNPDEDQFITKLKHFNHEMGLVAQPCRRQSSAQHLRYVEKCYNQGLIRRQSLGVFSVIWVDNYDEALSLYKAVCPHLQPEYSSLHKRVIDIGFWNKWWWLDQSMEEYDVIEEMV